MQAELKPNSSEKLMRGLFPGETSPPVPDDDDVPDDPEDLDDLCANAVSNAISLADWDISFTESTRFSWLFKSSGVGVVVEDPEPDPVSIEMITNTSNTSETTPSTFADRCVIPSNTDWVFGMYICKELIIRSRSTPLNIIGTFLVRDLRVSGSAIAAGVNWYNIWHPDALPIMYANNKLIRGTADSSGSRDCQTLMQQTKDKSGFPLWHSNPPAKFMSNSIKCSPSKFIYEAKLDNFLWTTVDPERGLISGEAATSAKILNRYRRFNSQDGMRNLYIK